MEKEITLNDISGFEQRYRATFINALGGFKSVALIGTINNKGTSNLAIFNSFFHLGANPPLFGFVVRPDSVERHTLTNILETKQFTVNHIQESFYKQAHQTSARYDSTISEFEGTGLTPDYKTGHIAPFVKESAIKIAAELVQKAEVIENGTVLIIAQIKSVYLPQDCVLTDGFIDLEKAGTLTCSGLDAYYKPAKIARLSYAKPDSIPREI